MSKKCSTMPASYQPRSNCPTRIGKCGNNCTTPSRRLARVHRQPMMATCHSMVRCVQLPASFCPILFPCPPRQAACLPRLWQTATQQPRTGLWRPLLPTSPLPTKQPPPRARRFAVVVSPAAQLPHQGCRRLLPPHCQQGPQGPCQHRQALVRRLHVPRRARAASHRGGACVKEDP